MTNFVPRLQKLINQASIRKYLKRMHFRPTMNYHILVKTNIKDCAGWFACFDSLLDIVVSFVKNLEIGVTYGKKELFRTKMLRRYVNYPPVREVS
jgi:hypothetical protein